MLNFSQTMVYRIVENFGEWAEQRFGHKLCQISEIVSAGKTLAISQR